MVSGLSTAEQASLEDLGLDVIVAVVVAFTISFELTALVTKSVLDPVGDLLKATERVKKGDLSTRVPVVSGDEMGSLAASFNQMVRGLEEREALRQAFGSYVDPEVAERVLQRGRAARGRAGRGDDALRGHLRLHRVRRERERARGGRAAERLLRAASSRS